MEELFGKLEIFLKKYYFNRFLKGLIFFVSVSLALGLLLIVFEYFGRFSTGVRKWMFFSYLIASLSFLVYFVIIPLLMISGFVKRMDFNEASLIIGKHFPQINDKLLNTLQLADSANIDKQNNNLILASIGQRIQEMRPVRFSLAVDFSENKKYLKLLLVPMAAGVIMFLSSPSEITQSSTRIINFNDDFERPEPFSIQILNNELGVRKGTDFKLELIVEGSTLPNELWISFSQKKFKLDGKTPKFSYLFKNVQKDVNFEILHNEIKPKKWILKVLPNPQLLAFQIEAQYPSYINRGNEVFENESEILLPEGTFIDWKFKTIDANSLSLIFSDSLLETKQISGDEFIASKQLFDTESYKVVVNHTDAEGLDTVNLLMRIVKDKYPQIDIEESVDSANTLVKYFKGVVKDDYGFTACFFNYEVLDENGDKKFSKQLPMKIDYISNLSAFSFGWNLNDMEIMQGESIAYYFTVFDNDGINGPKMSQSIKNLFKAPTKEELAKQLDENATQTKENLDAAINEAIQIQKQIEDIQKSLIDKKEIDWSDKEKLKDLLKKQENLEKKYEKLLNENKTNLKDQEKFKGVDEKLLDKQKQLQELMDKLLTEEMKEMMKELEDMLDKVDKNKLKEQLDKIQMSNEQMEKELDRSLELFKQLEFEQKLQQTIDEIEELKQKQEDLINDTENGEKSDSDLAKEQEALSNELDKVMEGFEKLQEKNEALENSNDLPDVSDELNESSEEMNEAKDELQKGQKKSGQQKQQKAKEQLEKAGESLSKLKQQMEEEKLYEDMESLRRLLQNLIQLSFDQEQIINDIKPLRRNDPAYVSITQNQKNNLDNSKVVEDSLVALSKRIMQIEPTITREMGLVLSNMRKTIDHLVDRKSPNAATTAQMSMTSINNLALLLDEILQQMQQDMNSMMQDGNCSKPGNNPKPGMSMGDVQKMQQKLNEQMKKMMEQMKNGKDGKGQSPGSQSMSEELAKTAAQQAALREELRKIQNEISKGKDGEGGALQDELKRIDELMNSTEEDLINKALSRETLKRQEEIITRLLESEKAQREQEEDEKRESKENASEFNLVDEFFEEYIKEKNKELEFLRTLPPEMKQFYKDKVNTFID